MLAVAETKRDDFVAIHGAQVESMITLEKHDMTDLSSISCLEGQEGTFDFITRASALVLLSDPAATVKQWVEYLKPGECIAVDVPHPHNLRAGVVLDMAKKRLAIEMLFNRCWVKSVRSLTSLLESAGREVERTEFVTQTGQGLRTLPGTVEHAMYAFEQSEQSLIQRNNRAQTAELKAAFIDEWRSAGEGDGDVRDVDGVWMAIARS